MLQKTTFSLGLMQEKKWKMLLSEGNWDFAFHVALPIAQYIREPEHLHILEIGHGGARILTAASRFFKKAIGVDIHDENDFIMEELHKRGINNIELLKANGENIPLGNDSVDVVYSFIVLQHVEKIEIFNAYLRETCRVLKPDGIAVLYFGREYKYSINKSSNFLYLLDRMYEKIKLKKGYREIPARVNETNLKVSLPYAKKLAEETDFKILKTLVSRRKVPDGVSLYGGQNGLVMSKKG